jgi:peroxiredoxin
MLANSQVAHRLGLIAAQSYRYSQTLLQCEFSAAAASTAKSTYNVPEGHHNSDLSSTACHIGLGRRRDLTMRQDLRLWDGETPLTLAQVFHNCKALLVGFPGGKVCTEQQLPGYAQAESALKSAGVDKVVCVTVGDPKEVQQWAATHGFDKAKMLQVLADRNQSFVRLLGVELGPEGPKCQRFAGVVDGGILLKLRVESSPADLKVTDAKAMCQTFKAAFGQHD